MKKKRVVIKIGSSNIVSNGKVDIEKLNRISDIIAENQKKGFEFIIVSSGAVAIGRETMKMKQAITMSQKQALAAIGQPYLMKKYKEAFHRNDIFAAQILLTSDDLYNRKRYINSSETINELLEMGVTPIINENDTVSTEEIKIGDNDNLSALVAAATESDILIILSDIDGLYTKNPHKYEDAVLIEEVEEITEEILAGAGGSSSAVGTGGMHTKLEAAKVTMKFGLSMYIVNGSDINNIEKVLSGEKIGTKFVSNDNGISRKKMWIAYVVKSKGGITIDVGAKEALISGKSLLASGVTGVSGDFVKGDMISVYDYEGNEIARGLVNYSSLEMKMVKGNKSKEIEEQFGKMGRKEVIHRDDMLLLRV